MLDAIQEYFWLSLRYWWAVVPGFAAELDDVVRRWREKPPVIQKRRIVVISIVGLFIAQFFAFWDMRDQRERALREAAEPIARFAPLDPAAEARIIDRIRAVVRKHPIKALVRYSSGNQLRLPIAEQIASMLADAGIDVDRTPSEGAPLGSAWYPISVMYIDEDHELASKIVNELDEYVRGSFFRRDDDDPQLLEFDLIIKISGEPRFMRDGSVILE